MRRRGISKDARGNEVHQVVNATDGTLTSVTDSNGQTVNYTYDESKRVTGVETTADGKAYRNAYTYENDRIKTVAHNTTGDTPDVTYTFNYDELGRKTAVKVGNQALSTNVYSPDRKSRLEEVQYGNGGKVKYTYDDFDRVTGVGYDNDESPRFSYEYDSKGRAAFVKDSTDGSTIRTGYDQTDRPNEAEQRDGEENLKYRTLIEYDKKNRVKAFNEATADANFKTEYTYDADNRVTKVRYNSSDTSKVDYVYDKLNRITSRTVTNGASSYATQYAYAPGATVYGENATTPLVSSITQGEGENAMNFAYTYDSRGNITSETRNGLTTTYVYDALGQLVRVNDPHENATWIYTYDRGGNILNKARYAYTTADELGEAVESIPYTYGDANWKDKLTAYNGVPITYDAIGNPLNDGTWTYEWQAGRQLKRMSTEGKVVSFKYDHNGLRTQKVVEADWGPETTNYYLHGKLLTHMTVDYRDTSEVVHQDVLHFFYDAQSRPEKVHYNGILYTYIHNLQGDIVGMLDNSGTLVVEYKYDAWGKGISISGSLATTLGERNPFRYRGYVYDEETGLYYLRSRYYNTQNSRFCSADTEIHTNATADDARLYVYCNNAPLSYTDDEGTFALAAFLIGVAVSTLVTSIATAIVGEDVVSGASTAVTGTAAVYTGIGLLSFGPIGWIAGGTLMLAGAATVVMGANEIAEGITGTNCIKEYIGIDDKTYDYWYYGLNAVSAMGTMAGNAYMYNHPRYPGNNPNRKPDGFTEWRGKPPVGGEKGAWCNPRNKQSLHPDFNHAEGIGPHWDWNVKDEHYRLFRFYRQKK